MQKYAAMQIRIRREVFTFRERRPKISAAGNATICVGLFQGAIQSLSRSYFAKIIPPERSGEYFGIYDICGKGASLLGTTVVSVVAQLTDNANLGVGALSVMFLLGGIFFCMTEKVRNKTEG